MRAVPNMRWLGLALFAVPACAQVLSLDDFGGVGTGPHCDTSEDCAEVVEPCFEATCENGTCGRSASLRGKKCDEGRACDGAGSCLTALGGECAAADECVISSCVDGVCCDAPACDPCSQCGGAKCVPSAVATADDDCEGTCDGRGGCANGTLDYGMILGGPGLQVFYDLAPLPDGGAVAVGEYSGPLTLGGKELLPVDTARNGLVVRLDALGEVVWVHGIGSVGLDDVAWSVSVASDGMVAVVGTTYFTAPTGPAGALVMFDPNDSVAPVTIGLAGAGEAYDVACVGEDVLVAGSIGALPFVTRYSRKGEVVQQVALGTNETSAGYVRRLELASDGGVLLAGAVKGAFAIGDVLNATDLDGFVARLDKDLIGQWLVPISSTGDDYAIDVAEAPSGDIIVGGFYSGAIPDLEFTPSTAIGGRSGFVLRLSPEREVRFAKGLGEDGDGVVYSVAADAHGNVVALGIFNGTVDLGGGLVAASDVVGAPAHDGFVAKYAADGTRLWSHVFGVAGPDGGFTLAVEPDTHAIRLVGLAGTAASIAGVNFTGTDLDRGALIARLEP